MRLLLTPFRLDQGKPSGKLGNVEFYLLKFMHDDVTACYQHY